MTALWIKETDKIEHNYLILVEIGLIYLTFFQKSFTDMATCMSIC